MVPLLVFLSFIFLGAAVSPWFFIGCIAVVILGA